MLDIRSHLFYLIAIFLFFGMGILVGASLIGASQVKQQSKAIAALRDQTNQTVKEERAAKDLLAKTQDALATLRPLVVRGKLAGKHVILIQTGDSPDAATAANKALSDAGVSEVDTVVLTAKWANLTPKQRQDIFAACSLPVPADTDTNAPLLASLGQALVGGTGAAQTSPVNLEVVQGFEQQDLITVTGDLTQPCSFFVLVGGAHDDAEGESPDAGMIDALSAASAGQATVVGCESSQAAVSFMPIYQKAGIATVDCIDLPLGQIALPFALRGEPGDYGIKPTAKQRLPDSLEGTAS